MSLLYSDKPVFGFDIGRSSIKIMQIEPAQRGGKPTVSGYGNIGFDPAAIDKGTIVQPEVVVKAAHELISGSLTGSLTTRHVAMSLPNTHSFSRVISAPYDVKVESLDTLVQGEIAQSIPMPIADLYYDFHVTKKGTEEQDQEVQLVASPRTIVDSYIEVVEALGLTPAVFEPNISAVTRMVVESEAHDEVSLIVDLGSEASDISVYDGTVVRATGTASCGGEHITRAISKSLGTSPQQAHSIKTRYGLGVSKKQSEIIKAIDPELAKLVREIKKVMRYYEERADDDKQIGQIILLGGGANLPGLSTYLTDKTRTATRLNAPFINVNFKDLQPPHELETTIYTTAGGLSLLRPEDIT
ncbi:MAG: type IV pilus assembly protein PilM [Patescibacteria group bacterium]